MFVSDGGDSLKWWWSRRQRLVLGASNGDGDSGDIWCCSDWS